MNLFAIAAIIFSIFALSRVFLRWRGKEESTSWFLVWSAVFLGVLVAAIFPQIFWVFSHYLGMRTADLFLFTGLGFNFYILFKFYIKIEKTQQEITRLVREIAIKDAKNEEKK